MHALQFTLRVNNPLRVPADIRISLGVDSTCREEIKSPEGQGIIGDTQTRDKNKYDVARIFRFLNWFEVAPRLKQPITGCKNLRILLSHFFC